MRFLGNKSQKISLFVLGLTAFNISLNSSSAQAASISYLRDQNQDNVVNDLDFNSLLDNGKFTELFVAEGRVGDLSKAATYELSINRDVKLGAQPLDKTQKQYAWAKDKDLNTRDTIYDWEFKTVDFSLEYTSGVDANGKKTGYVSYILDGIKMEATDFKKDVIDVNNIFLRTRSNRSDSSMILSNLMFNNKALKNSKGTTKVTSLDSIGVEVDYLRINDINSNFKLTGTAAMSWDKTKVNPTQSNLAFQIKVGNSPKKKRKVPEPNTLAAIFIAGVIGSGLKKKQQQATQEIS
jgi:hypothetical protein